VYHPVLRQTVRVGGLAAIVLALSAAGASAQPAAPYDPRYDLTASTAVDGGDAAVAAGAWSEQVEASCQPGVQASADVNGDGCLDVVDVQLIAAHAGAAAAVPAGVQESSGRTWTVTTANDEVDSAPGNGVCRTDAGRCSLRAAIDEANRSVGSDTIVFDVRAADGSCPAVVTILADGALRAGYLLDDPRGDGTVIDGYTQCGARPNSAELHGDALIKVELRGNYTRSIHGLRIASPNNVVRGLAIYNWDRQIELFGNRARYNRIEGVIAGTNAAQTYASRSMSTHHTEGIRIHLGASYTIVGCGAWGANGEFQPCSDAARARAARNIIAGNGDDGIHVESSSFHNRIVGNYIGLKQDGQTRLKNGSDGVDFEQGPQHTWLGGLTPLERNIISGNGSDGIEISHGTDTQFNHVAGNYFGLDASGTKAVPNVKNGISFEDAVDQNYAHGNVVSGNDQGGFRFYVLATRNEVRGNLVGVAADGQTPLPNRHNGVYIMGGSQHNLISENVIANNRDHGVFLASTSDADNNYAGRTYYNTITRNQIYSNRKLGIEFYTPRDLWPNENLPAPVLGRANTIRVEGSACPGCVVEIFVADAGGESSGQGRQFVGQGRADGEGRFTFDIQPVAPGQFLTATATDVKGNTSRFGRNIAVTDTVIGDPTPAPTLTFTPLPDLTPTATERPVQAGEIRVWLPFTQR
jgi:CSLREA domain-containing protein